MEPIPEVDLIPLMEPIPIVEPVPFIDMIPTIMIPIPTYPHYSMGDSDSDSKNNWNHNISNTYLKIEFHTLVLIPHLVPIPAVEPALLLVPILLWNRLWYWLFWQSRTVAPAPVPTPEKIGIVSALI